MGFIIQMENTPRAAMAECYNCGAQVANDAATCPECGAQFAQQGQQGHQGGHQHGGQDQHGQQGTQQMADGGSNTELGGAVISVVSVFYFLLNLLGTLTFLGLGGAAGSVGAGGAAAQAGLTAIVSFILTIGFIAAPVGVFTDASWGWTVMAGVWALSLLWRLFGAVTSGVGAPGLIFMLINVAVLGWIYVNKKTELPIGGQGTPSV
jgi:hypothetical protein